MALTLTPVGGGRFEVYLNGEELYNRKNAPTIEKSVADVRTIVVLAEEIRGKLLAALDAADAAQPAAAAAAH